MTSLIIDIMAAVLIIMAFIVGSSKGLVKSVWRVAAWVITAVLVFILLEPTVDFLSGTKIASTINDTVCDKLQSKIPNMEGTASEEQTSKVLGLPSFITNNLDLKDIKAEEDGNLNEAASGLAQQITLIIIKISAFIVLFLILRMLLAILFKVLDTASKLPIINSANKLLGGLLGAVNVLFIIYIICAAVSLFAAGDNIADIINKSYIVKYFYNNNILLQLAFRV